MDLVVLALVLVTTDAFFDAFFFPELITASFGFCLQIYYTYDGNQYSWGEEKN
jgi:hypothetical protein